MAAAGRAAAGVTKTVASIRRQDRALRGLHDKLECRGKARNKNGWRGPGAGGTGGPRGIGGGIVKARGEAGCAAAVNYRERAGEAGAPPRKIVTAGGKAVAIAADVSKADAVAAMAA